MRRKIADIMTRVVEQVAPGMSVRAVATLMKDRNIGCFPVCDEDRLIGMITDRDLAVRVLAEGRDPDVTRVDDVMTKDVVCCDKDDLLSEVTDLMSQWRIRRIPVVSGEGGLVGLVTLGKLAATDASASGEVLKQVIQPDIEKRT
jgi:CBS domain-containing protein